MRRVVLVMSAADLEIVLVLVQAVAFGTIGGLALGALLAWCSR